ncbi:MAG: hypothetical protein ACOX52_13925 [Verrucomicrobiota bacterium]|jgi:hypothetical protein
MEEPTAIPSVPSRTDSAPAGDEAAAVRSGRTLSLFNLGRAPLFGGPDFLFAVLPLWLYEICFLLTWSGSGSAKQLVGSNLGSIYIGLAVGFIAISGFYFHLGKTKLFRRPWFSVWLGCVLYTVSFYVVFLAEHRLGVRIHVDFLLLPLGLILALGLGLVGSGWNAALLVLPWVLFYIPAVNGGPSGLLHPSSFALISILGLLLSTALVILYLLTRTPHQKWAMLLGLVLIVAALNLWAVSVVAPKLPEAIQDLGRQGTWEISKATLLTLAIFLLAVSPEFLRNRFGMVPSAEADLA